MDNFSNTCLIFKRFFSRKIDGLIVYKQKRWYSYFGTIFFFILRMVLKNGFFAIAYFLGFYTMQNVILYMTPSGIPSITDVRTILIQAYISLPVQTLCWNILSNFPRCCLRKFLKRFKSNNLILFKLLINFKGRQRRRIVRYSGEQAGAFIG